MKSTEEKENSNDKKGADGNISSLASRINDIRDIDKLALKGYVLGDANEVSMALDIFKEKLKKSSYFSGISESITPSFQSNLSYFEITLVLKKKIKK